MNGSNRANSSLRARLTALPPGMRHALAILVVVGLVGSVALAVRLGRPEQAVLFAGLDPADAATTFAELARQDVPADLTDGGTTITVPRDQVDRLRMDLASRGLPGSGTVGYEIFDGKADAGSAFRQNVDFKRALEGELARSIETLQGIRAARVHLVLPGSPLFAGPGSTATASVVLEMGRAARLGRAQVAGIQSLVAGSVEALAASDVTVIDRQGTVLSPSAGGGDAEHAASQLGLRKEVETYLAEKAGTMLDRVLGAGRSVVRVDATLNFEKIDREREIYDPAATVVRSEAHTESNVPADGASREQSETSYEINRTVEHIVSAPGGVRSLSVAVFVDGHYETPDTGGAPVYTPLGEDELAQIERVVRTALGVDGVRGDRIEVVNMPFRQTATPGVAGAAPAPDWLGLAERHGGRVVLVAMLVLVGLALRRSVERLLAGAPRAAAASGGISAGHGAGEGPRGAADVSHQTIQDIQDYATENPERVAEVIQSWIHDLDLAVGREHQAAGD